MADRVRRSGLKLKDLFTLMRALGVGGVLGALSHWLETAGRVEAKARELDHAVRELLPILPAHRTDPLIAALRDLFIEVSVLREASSQLGRAVSKR